MKFGTTCVKVQRCVILWNCSRLTLLGHKDSGDYELQRRNHSVCFVVTDWGMSHVLTHLFCIIIFLSREPWHKRNSSTPGVMCKFIIRFWFIVSIPEHTFKIPLEYFCFIEAIPKILLKPIKEDPNKYWN